MAKKQSINDLRNNSHVLGALSEGSNERDILLTKGARVSHQDKNGNVKVCSTKGCFEMEVKTETIKKTTVNLKPIASIGNDVGNVGKNQESKVSNTETQV